MNIIKPGEFRKNYIENTDEFIKFGEALNEGFKNKWSFATLVVGLGDLQMYYDIADYCGYKITLREGLTPAVLDQKVTRIYIKPKDSINNDKKE